MDVSEGSIIVADARSFPVPIYEFWSIFSQFSEEYLKKSACGGLWNLIQKLNSHAQTSVGGRREGTRTRESIVLGLSGVQGRSPWEILHHFWSTKSVQKLLANDAHVHTSVHVVHKCARELR